MKEDFVGDIWSLHPSTPYGRERSDGGMWVVIPTNIGWRRDFSNVMGRGLARQASQRFPLLAAKYGRFCLEHKAQSSIVLYPEDHLIMFPTKTLLLTNPQMSWNQDSSLTLIERSTKDLSRMVEFLEGRPVAIPLVGCGNGGLSETLVLPVLRAHLSDQFHLVRDRRSSPHLESK